MMINKLTCLSEDKKLLCICNADSVVKFWDTSSNVLEYEFHPGVDLSSSVTCLHFSPKSTVKNFKNKKKKNCKVKDTSDLRLALGTVEGCVLIYNVLQQKVLTSLRHSSSSPVVDVSWHSEDQVISIGDKKLILWNVNNTKLYLLDVIDCSSVCVLAPHHFAVASTCLQVISYDTNTETMKEDSFPVHKTAVTQLIPVIMEGQTDAEYFLSAAENDRYVYAWSLNTIRKKNSVASFMVKDAVRTVSCIPAGESSIVMAVVTNRGYLRLFSHYFNGKRSSKPISFEGTLRIESKEKSTTLLSILTAELLSTSELIVVYGSELYPQSERIEISSLRGDVCLTRSDPSNFTKSQKVKSGKAVTPHVPDTAVHLMPVQMKPPELKEVSTKRKKGEKEVNLPMEERLNSLSLMRKSGDWPGGRPLDNYVHLLVQGLHSKDSSLLNSILSRGEDEEVIEKTVRRLPLSNVVPFLQYLQDVILDKGVKNLTCINWIKSVLVHHMSHLSAIPEKETLLSPFSDAFCARTPALLAVSKLHARISLLLTHVKSRHEHTALASSTDQPPTTSSDLAALVYYKEESSDDEDLRVEVDGGGPSESSEDIWDDWTEDEEEANGTEDDEEETEENGEDTKRSDQSSSLKRKELENEDYMEIGDDDDETSDESEEDDGDDSMEDDV